MVYRREIDGLRSFAVLPVILFHGGFALFGGGFIGVDIFFVISGFLITSIILEEHRLGQFSLLNFYERRARRILPALFFVMLVTIPFGWWLLSPSDLRDFAQSLVAITVFASNILFWQESGYFDTAAELKPMLHTWSLAVEEQYYVLFPLLIMAAWRLGTRRLAWLIAAIGAASLLIAELQLRSDPTAAFFLLPARAWQLLVGSLAAFVVLDWPRYPRLLEEHRVACEILGAIGLAMIVGATFLFHDRLPFPGLLALVPTIGTALILLCSTSRTLVGRLLGFAPLVGIGLISYSAYLWHQPLFAFVRHASVGEVAAPLMLALSGLTLLLAYLSWRFVEQPFRDRKRIKQSTVFSFSIAGILVFSSIGLAGHFAHQSITDLRFRSIDPALRSLYQDRDTLYDERTRVVQSFFPLADQPFSDDPETRKILILGDSVSGDLFGSLMLNAPLFSGLEIRRMALDDPCMPDYEQVLRSGEMPSIRDDHCRRSIERLNESNLLAAADLIVLSAHWAQEPGDRPHLGVMSLAETLAEQGREVALVGLLAMKDAASMDFHILQRGLSVEQANEYAYMTLRQSRIDPPNDDIQALAARVPNIHFLDKYALFCDDLKRSCTLYDETGRLLFSDSVHVSVAGAAHYGQRIAAAGWFDL
ncbi:hypothetical protein CKO25_15490 [Thiocapsa imhoffii]|uniref:Acyltransferase n=1 Tax=Thiocapsa imhoffii TaxID=382777 RepID=A0A9X0WKZ4_9GAMM|nr:acyltransferase family protein [Thiocapsa imhoffii]MBK1646027.1 hypothetical protein [Thiocapsa imhoffii]